jgi:hypothetical protein
MRTNRILPKFEREVLELVCVDRSMESRVKSLGIAVALVLCAALAVGSGLAQEQAPQAGSDRDAPPADGVGIGAKNGRAVAKSSDAGGDRGAGQSGPREGDAVHAGLRAVANRKGAAATPGVLGTPSSDRGVMLDHGMSPIRLSEGLAALLRRANRKTLVAITPSAAPSTNTGAHTPMRPGADGGAMRNAIGVVVPGGGQGPVGTGPGTIGAGTPAGNVGGADVRRPAIPLNAATGPAAHTAGINSTTMGHIAFGPSYIGGPAKDRSGINGTAMRPRH